MQETWISHWRIFCFAWRNTRKFLTDNKKKVSPTFFPMRCIHLNVFHVSKKCRRIMHKVNYLINLLQHVNKCISICLDYSENFRFSPEARSVCVSGSRLALVASVLYQGIILNLMNNVRDMVCNRWWSF